MARCERFWTGCRWLRACCGCGVGSRMNPYLLGPITLPIIARNEQPGRLGDGVVAKVPSANAPSGQTANADAGQWCVRWCQWSRQAGGGAAGRRIHPSVSGCFGRRPSLAGTKAGWRPRRLKPAARKTLSGVVILRSWRPCGTP